MSTYIAWIALAAYAMVGMGFFLDSSGRVTPKQADDLMDLGWVFFFLLTLVCWPAFLIAHLLGRWR